MTSDSRYELLEKIASGSYATVYRGRDLELGREIAIKQIHDQYLQDPQQLDRYWQEAQLLASYQHPNIVTIFDVVREKGWLILELMQSDLSRLAGRKQMDLNALRTTLAHCLRALKFLHSHGIVHGDVKPSNMMIDRRRRVKIGDFGLARRVSDAEGSLIKGTTKYMAPEVVSDEFGDVGPASDLYSLGFAAYELMCGENFESLFPGLNAFGRDRQMAWMMWHAAPDRRLPEITRVLADVPEDLARTIQKLVAKPQSERYRSADEALSDLKIDLKLVRTGEESVDNLGKSTITALPVDRRRWLIVGAFVVSVALSVAMLLMPTGGDKPTYRVADDKPLGGVVREVLLDKQLVVIEDEEGHPEDVPVGEKPRISLDGQKYIQLREVQPQDRVEFRPATSARFTAEILVLRPAEGHGEIKALDPAGSKLTALIAADPHPQEVPMFVPKGAELRLNGKKVELSDLAPGDPIVVTHLKDTSARAARDVIHLEARRTMTLTGFVREVTSSNGKSWLVIERQGASTSVELAEDCQVTIFGNTDGNKTVFTPQDLRPGDRVVVTHDIVARSVAAERRSRQSGLLTKIDLSAREILVLSDDGREVTYQVNDSCRINVDDKSSALDDLRKNDLISVTFEATEGAPPAAVTIDVLRPKKI